MSADKMHSPIGEILLEKGLITRQQLDEALKEQENCPEEKLGEILVRLNYVSMKDVIQAYAEQVLMEYDESEEEEISFNANSGVD